MAPTTTLATPALDESVNAGRSPSEEGAGFERDDHGSSPGGRAGRSQRRRLGVRMPGPGVGSFADHLAVSIEHDGPDSGIGMGAMCRGQFERPAHVGAVVSTTQRAT